MTEVSITIPLTPPSVNNYVRHTRAGRHYITKEAIAFMQAIANLAQGQQLRSESYAVTYTVYQGKGERGDVDNYAKCIGDGLAKAGVIHSDAAITEYHQYKRRDRENARTEITVRAI